jgi:hypothetical protein
VHINKLYAIREHIMKKYISIFLLAFLFCGFSLIENLKDIQIKWVENLNGDFSFSPKHTLDCEAWCYEFAGTSEIEAKRLSKDTIECYTFPDAATHSTLNFYIVNNVIKNARIELNSITGKKLTYPCNLGFMKIDKNFIEKNILKADFDMKFDHTENRKRKMFWKGKILTEIK